MQQLTHMEQKKMIQNHLKSSWKIISVENFKALIWRIKVIFQTTKRSYLNTALENSVAIPGLIFGL